MDKSVPPFLIVAHRGHQGVAPENTIEAFDGALAAGRAAVFVHLLPCSAIDPVAVLLPQYVERASKTQPGPR
jgi:hypothetical protein